MKTAVIPAFGEFIHIFMLLWKGLYRISFAGPFKTKDHEKVNAGDSYGSFLRMLGHYGDSSRER